MDPVAVRYKDMLLDVANFIEDGDLQRMKFKCDQIVKKAESQKISDPTQFFTALEQREYLGPRKLDFLKELLKTCCSGRLDGLRSLEQYERDIGLSPPHFNQLPNGVPIVQGSQQPQIVYVVNEGTNQHVPQAHRNNGYKRYDGPDLTKELEFLSRRIGKDWRFYVRALGVPEEDIENICYEYRSVRERIYQCFCIWKQMDQQMCSKYRLIDALRDPSVQRNDLATELEDGNYS